MPECNLYVHVTMLPGQAVSSVEEELREMLRDHEEEDPALKVELLIYSANNGYEIPVNHALVQVMDRAHETVFGAPPIRPEPGRYSVSWDRRGNRGARVPAGVYTCRFTAGQHQEQRRMIVFP